VCRSRAAAIGSAELLYDAVASRRGASASGTISVADRPGRSLTLQAEGPFGLRVAKGTWDGSRVVVETFGKTPRVTQGDPESFGDRFGIPLSASELSWLFVGLPEDADPETISVDGRDATLSWRGGAVECDFDPELARPRRCRRRAGKSVEVAFLSWRDDVPAEMTAEIGGGGSARLVLRAVSTTPR
jgi:hypothetical protein